MAKQLNIDMRFNADTSAAKAQLQGLQTSINQLTTSMATQGAQLGITPKIQEAQQAAIQLKTALSQSMNVETGKFDLSKFNSSLKSMNTDLSKLKTQLVNLGPSGQQTFMTLAQSIMTAEIPTKRIGASLAALGTTLKNTAKWQLSSMMLHGFISSIQTSLRYAQDLNKSLNNIRIVTGESAEAMDQFAIRANRAAKALSASTLDYTNAALIYYQQGLKGKAVEERTEVTLKLANVSRQSAEVVSDQMTAIWNNFYDGSKSLEYYADVLTKLGATTASSTAEIAGGLEKFAAVGDTIGLSYEYAAAALATITANTRQSEDVVGTALKTIFARIQGLKLGETLEDGTELNKYSEALQKVGVDIFDDNEQLKNMDQILDETAAKWETLTKAQQAALAQTVAGVRQYTQFIALMDNWDDGTSDSMVNNIKTAVNATGELQDQADIYAQSWEGASKRVKAAAEQVYSDLLNDKFFIGLTNFFGGFLELVDNLLDSMGGAKGLLMGLSSILLTTFSGQAAKGLESMVYNFKTFVGLTQQEAMNTKQYAAGLIKDMTINSGAQASPTQTAQVTGLSERLTLEQELLKIEEKLTAEEKKQVEGIIEINGLYAEQVAKAATALETQQAQTKKDTAATREAALMHWDGKEVDKKFANVGKDIRIGETIAEKLQKADAEFLKAPTTGAEKYVEKIQKLIQKAESAGFTDTAKHLKTRIETKSGNQRTAEGMRQQVTGRENGDENLKIKASQDVERKARKTFSKDGQLIVDEKEITKTTKSMTGLIQKENQLNAANKALATNTKKGAESIRNLGNSTKTWSQNIVGVSQACMSFGFAITSLNSVITTWGDNTKSTGEKILQTFMSMGMAIPMLINALKGLNAVTGVGTLMSNARITSIAGEILAMTGLSNAEKAELLQKKLGIGVTEAANVVSRIAKNEKLSEALAAEGVTAAEKKGIIAKGMSKLATMGVAIASKIAAVGKTTETSAVAANTVAWYANPIMWIALVIAGVVAAIILLVAWIVNMTTGLSENEKALQQSQQALEGLTQAYENAKQKVQEFKDTLSNYDQARNALKDLEKGTTEYAEKVREANEHAMELIKNFSELQGKYVIGEDGLITIDHDALQEVEKKLINRQQTAALALNAGEIDYAKKSQAVRKDEIKNEFAEGLGTKGMYDEFQKYFSDLSKSDKKEDQVKAETMTTTDIAQWLKNNYGSNYSDAEYTQLAQELMDSRTSLENLDNTTQAQIEAIQANTKALLKEQYGGELVDEYGTGAVYGAEKALLDEKAKDFNGSGKTAEAYFKGKLGSSLFGQNNNVSNLGLDDQKLLAEVLGVDVKDIAGGEIKFEDGKVKVTGGKADDKDIQYVGSINDFNTTASGATVSQEEIEQYLSDPQKIKEAEEKAVKAGIIKEEDRRQFDGKFAGATIGQAKKLEERNFGKYENEVASYFQGLEPALKQGVADGLADLKIEDIEKAGSVEKAMKTKENDLRSSQYAADLGLDQGAFDNYVDNLQKTNKELANNREAAQKTAKAQIELQQKVKSLNTTYEDLKDDLDASKKGTTEFYTACEQMGDALNSAFGTSNFDGKFVSENLDLVKSAMDGNIASAEKLFDLAGQDLLIDVGINIDDGVGKQINDWIGSQEFNDLEIGTTLDETGMMDSFQHLLDSGQVTADEMNEILKGIGYEPEIEEKEVEVTGNAIQNADGTTTATVITGYNDDGTPIKTTVTLPTSSYSNIQSGSKIKIPIINGKNTVKVSTPKSFAKAASQAKKSNSGGGGDKNKTTAKKDKKKYSTEFDVYRDLTEALEDYGDQLERIQDLKDELWGPRKLQYLQQERKELEKIIKKQKEYIQAISGDYGQGGNLGVKQYTLSIFGGQFNEEGKLTNYSDLTNTWLREYNAVLQKWNDNIDGADEATKEKLDKELEDAEKLFEKRKTALDEWQTAYDLSEEQLKQLQERERQLKELNYEEITYKVEFKIEMSDIELEQIEYYLAKSEDDIYQAAESVVYYGKQIAPLTNNLQTYYNMFDELQEKYLAGEITQRDYFEGLQEAQSGMIENINALEDALESVGEYYLDTLNQVNEKLDVQNEKYDNLISKLEHFKDITVMINGEQDYETLGNIIASNEKVTTDQLKTAENRLTMLQGQEADIKARLAQAEAEGDQKTIDKLQNDLNEVQSLIVEEETKIMDAITRLGELAIEELTNTLGKAKKKMQETLFGDDGLNIDSMMAQIDRLNSKQEEYLTNTNKLYETNKLIKQAQMDMNKTDNLRAKQQYADYVKYIEQLQQAGQLSQFELELAQADYDILQKKIALEEAQEAKNQVRLTRDAEGNYGYVYTANQDNIDKAEQELADAQNSRYNIALEGAQKYQDQYYQAIADMNAALDELEEERQNKLITEEEYERRKVEITQTYLDIAQTAYDLYYKATGVMLEESADNRLDYTLKGVGDMETLRDATEEYLEDVEEAFDVYDEKIETVAEHNETNFGKIDESMEEIEKESERVRQETDKLIDKFDTELSDTLENSMLEWYSLRDAIKAAREETELYLQTIGQETEVLGTEDYAQAIIDEYAKGENADMDYIERLIKERNIKLDGIDLTNYAALMEGLDPNSAEYKAYDRMRQEKIKMMQETDYSQMLEDYLSNGGKLSDRRAKDILTMREHKIAALGLTNIESNDDLVARLTKHDQDEIEPMKAEVDEETASVITSQETSATDNNSDPPNDPPNDPPKGEEKWVFRIHAKHGNYTEYDSKDTYSTSKEALEKGKEYISGRNLNSSDFTVQTYKEDDLPTPLKKQELHQGTYYRGKSEKIPRYTTTSYGQVLTSTAAGQYNIGYNREVYATQIINGVEYVELKGFTGKARGMWFKKSDLVKQDKYYADRTKAQGNSEPGHYDTGGYTGEWGPEGKLAVLHEKELVLNKDDTTNFLTATQMLREISQMLDNNALVASLGMINLHAMTIGNPADQILQQEVTIHADFPNVTDHNEIEIAIDNLINAASQHAYKV